MRDSINWIGFDEDATKIVVARLVGYEQKTREGFTVEFNERGLRQLVRRLKQLEGGEVRCVYEAGGSGYELYRYLRRHGIGCEVAAPSLTPRKPGDRVKTNRRDAEKLAVLYRGAELTMISVPDEARESLRDLVRAREDAQQDLLRQRNRLTKMLYRRALRHGEGRRWTQSYWRWLRGLRVEDAHLQTVLDDAILSIEHAAERLRRVHLAVMTAAQEPAYAPTVRRLMVFRGVAVLTAISIIAELGDLRRFTEAKKLMAAVGVTPSEFSTGPHERRFGITKTGNAHLRYLIVEAAWHAQHRPSARGVIVKRRADQPGEVVEIARRCEQRLHRKYMSMTTRGKPSSKAAVAVARELLGFIWAVAQIPL
jgi:transposase